MYKAISFFTGAGGLDIGIQKAGFDVKLAVEIEKTYRETLRMNHPELNIADDGDIMNYNKQKVYEGAKLEPDEVVDFMFGGSPCQSFSTAGGRQSFQDPRGQAMIKFAKLIQEVQPKVFLLENVRGLLSAALKHRPLNQRTKDDPPLEEDELQGSAVKYLLSYFNDYNVTYELINSANMGVPQTRQRVFFIGVHKSLGIKYKFPETTHSKTAEDGKKPWVTLGELLKNLKVEKHHHVSYTPERMRFMQMIPKGGGNWRDLRTYGEDVVKEAMGGAYNSGGGKVGFFRRLDVNKPAPTVLTSPNQKSTVLGHPYEDRPLSIEEFLAIQEFPLDYKISGTLAKQYIQIGNAVPVRVATVLGKSIFELLEKIEVSQHQLV